MGFAIIIIANLLLVQVNSSNTDSIFVTAKRLFKSKTMWIINVAVMVVLIVMIYTPLNNFLKLGALSAAQFFVMLGFAVASVLWYEVVKFVKRRMQKTKSKYKNSAGSD